MDTYIAYEENGREWVVHYSYCRECVFCVRVYVRDRKAHNKVVVRCVLVQAHRKSLNLGANAQRISRSCTAQSCVYMIEFNGVTTPPPTQM